MHGLLTDYPYVAFVSIAPETLGFTEEKRAKTLCRFVSSGILASSFLTRAEWGLIPAISYKTHLALDVANGLFAASAPWLFGFSRNKRARNTFLAMGIVGILAGTLSKSNEMTEAEMQRKFPA
ncbi:MAG: hypothetical protein JWN60_695 [Acidobacteria bacterium]|nr:hypothetical protein [Acidobacteriota bacterium]